MELVVDHIEKLTDEYKKHKLWSLLDGSYLNTLDNVDPSKKTALQRLKYFAPTISYFILSFKDVNDFVLPYENPKNSLEKSINTHAVEDATHYRLFIEDWEKLGGDSLLDPYSNLIPVPTSGDHRIIPSETAMTTKTGFSNTGQVMSFLWSDSANRHNRKLLFEYTKLVNVAGADPAVRFAIIEAVEETGLVMFNITSNLVQEVLTSDKRTDYRYFGEYHLALETGHLVNQEEAPKAKPKETPLTVAHLTSSDADIPFKKLSLSEKQQDLCIKSVDKVFVLFSEWLDGIYNLMISKYQ